MYSASSSPDSHRSKVPLTAENPEVRRLQPLPSDHSPTQSPTSSWDSEGRLLLHPEPEQSSPKQKKKRYFPYSNTRSQKLAKAYEDKQTKDNGPLHPPGRPPSASWPPSENPLDPPPENPLDPPPAPPSSAPPNPPPNAPPGPTSGPPSARAIARKKRNAKLFEERQDQAADRRRNLWKKRSKRPHASQPDSESFEKFLERQRQSGLKHITVLPEEDIKPERLTVADGFSQAVSSAPSIFSEARDEMRKLGLTKLREAREAEVEHECPGKPVFQSGTERLREAAGRKREKILQEKAVRQKELHEMTALGKEGEQDHGIGRPEIHPAPEYVQATNKALGRKPWKPLVPESE